MAAMTFPQKATVRLRQPDGSLHAYTETELTGLDHARWVGQYLWEAKGGKGPYYASGMLLSYEAIPAAPPPVLAPPVSPPRPAPAPVAPDPEPDVPEAPPEPAPQEPPAAHAAPVLKTPLRVSRPRRRPPQRAQPPVVEAPAVHHPFLQPLAPIILRVRERSTQQWRVSERGQVQAKRWGGVAVRVPLPREYARDPEAYVLGHLDRGPLVIAGVRVPEAVVGGIGTAVVSLVVTDHVPARQWMKDGGGEVLDAESGQMRRVVVR